ncbi:hypothetical protein R1T08_02645 [Streptomyces sp. SBC-4]|nr:hypothetical protein [Streptomyces sp. SBC-4]MDV5143234.1 hypothetical protein [Streptomyces sp. SBC-4]
MIHRMFHRCGPARGALTPEDQAVVDAFLAMLAARRSPAPWTPGQDVAVRVGPFLERGHIRPGDDYGPDVVAIALQHPDGPHAPYAERYHTRGWLRCETTRIIGAWNPAYAVLTHAHAGFDLPDDTGMEPAHYAVLVDARKPDGTGYTILRLGPYTQTEHTVRDADRLTAALDAQESVLIPGFTIVAQPAPYDPNNHARFTDPYETDAVALLAAAVEGAAAP